MTGIKETDKREQEKTNKQTNKTRIAKIQEKNPTIHHEQRDIEIKIKGTGKEKNVQYDVKRGGKGGRREIRKTRNTENKKRRKRYVRISSQGRRGKAELVAWSINIPLDLGMMGGGKLRGGVREGKGRTVTSTGRARKG